MTTQACVHGINFSRIIVHHIVGKTHTNRHRKIAGGSLILVTTTIAKTIPVFIHFILIHIAIDTIAGIIIGIGILPWILPIEKLEENNISQQQQTTNETVDFNNGQNTGDIPAVPDATYTS